MAVKNGSVVSKAMAAAMAGHQIGRRIVIKMEPPKAAKHGFHYGSEHYIVKPPEGHINSPAGVYVKSVTGKTIQLQFPYWGTLSEKKEFNEEMYIANHEEKDKSETYVPAAAPEYVAPRVIRTVPDTEDIEIVRRKPKVIEDKIPVRRKKVTEEPVPVRRLKVDIQDVIIRRRK